MGKVFRPPPGFVGSGKMGEVSNAMAAPLVVVTPKIDFQSSGAGADIIFTASGLEALVETLRNVPKAFRDAAGYEMANIAHEIIEDAKANYVPYDTGALHDSGDADEYRPHLGAEITEIAMWFGAPLSASQMTQGIKASIHESVSIKDPSKYAWVQHELPFNHHPPPDLTGPKYLERPLVKVQDGIYDRIARAAGVALRTQESSGSDYFADLESSLRGAPNYPGYGSK